MYQLIDFLNPTADIGIAERIDKINHNISQVEVLKQNIEQQKANNKNAVICMTVLGRWIVVYKSNLTNDDDTIMYFLDFRIEAELFLQQDIFSEKIISGIKQIQTEYDKVYNDSIDNFELTFAEPFEKILKPNLFVCDNDNIVLDTAKRLGALPIIKNLKEGNTVKVTLIDEKIKLEDKSILNIYALIHFGGHGEESRNENGFAYIKLFDLINNLDKINDFQKFIEGAGGKFDRIFFTERFTNERLN